MARKKDSKTKKKPEKRCSAKARKFGEIYDGNGTKNARDAGYSGNDNTLAVTASRLLRNAKVLEIIEKRQEKEKSALIADRTEREEILSSILRNNKVCEISPLAAGAEIGETPEGETKIVKLAVVDKDKIKAIDVLNKMDALYIQRREHSGEIKTGITFADGLKQVRDQLKGNPEEEARLLGEVIDE